MCDPLNLPIEEVVVLCVCGAGRASDGGIARVPQRQLQYNDHRQEVDGPQQLLQYHQHCSHHKIQYVGNILLVPKDGKLNHLRSF